MKYNIIEKINNELKRYFLNNDYEFTDYTDYIEFVKIVKDTRITATMYNKNMVLTFYNNNEDTKFQSLYIDYKNIRRFFLYDLDITINFILKYFTIEEGE